MSPDVWLQVSEDVTPLFLFIQLVTTQQPETRPVRPQTSFQPPHCQHTHPTACLPSLYLRASSLPEAISGPQRLCEQGRTLRAVTSSSVETKLGLRAEMEAWCGGGCWGGEGAGQAGQQCKDGEGCTALLLFHIQWLWTQLGL